MKEKNDDVDSFWSVCFVLFCVCCVGVYSLVAAAFRTRRASISAVCIGADVDGAWSARARRSTAAVAAWALRAVAALRQLLSDRCEYVHDVGCCLR